MDKKMIGILSYLTIIGWLVAYYSDGWGEAKQHLNQGLVLGVAQLFLWISGGLIGALLGWIPVVGALIGWILAGLGFAIVLVQVYGVILAVTDNDSPMPVIGGISIVK